jgi:hypothetical protein
MYAHFELCVIVQFQALHGTLSFAAAIFLAAC